MSAGNIFLGAALGALVSTASDTVFSAIHLAATGDKRGFGLWRLSHDVHMDPSRANVEGLIRGLVCEFAVPIAFAGALSCVGRLVAIHCAAKSGADFATVAASLRRNPRVIGRLESQVRADICCGRFGPRLVRHSRLLRACRGPFDCLEEFCLALTLPIVPSDSQIRTAVNMSKQTEECAMTR